MQVVDGRGCSSTYERRDFVALTRGSPLAWDTFCLQAPTGSCSSYYLYYVYYATILVYTREQVLQSSTMMRKTRCDNEKSITFCWPCPSPQALRERSRNGPRVQCPVELYKMILSFKGGGKTHEFSSNDTDLHMNRSGLLIDSVTVRKRAHHRPMMDCMQASKP